MQAQDIDGVVARLDEIVEASRQHPSRLGYPAVVECSWSGSGPAGSTPS